MSEREGWDLKREKRTEGKNGIFIRNYRKYRYDIATFTHNTYTHTISRIHSCSLRFIRPPKAPAIHVCSFDNLAQLNSEGFCQEEKPRTLPDITLRNLPLKLDVATKIHAIRGTWSKHRETWKVSPRTSRIAAVPHRGALHALTGVSSARYHLALDKNVQYKPLALRHAPEPGQDLCTYSSWEV